MPNWLIGYRHPSIGYYNKKAKGKKKWLAFLFLAIGAIPLFPDFNLSLVVGALMLSGISIKTKIKSIKYDLIERWRLR